MNGLKYISWADNTGYAVSAKAYLRALDASGVEISWATMMPTDAGYALTDGPTTVPPPLAHLQRRAIDYDTVLLHTTPEYYPALLAPERSAGKRVFGYTVWEVERLPAHWPGILNQLDGVLVPCRWNIAVFRDAGVTVPVHLVPHLPQLSAVEATPEDRTALRRRLGDPGNTASFVVYTIAHWSARKAPHLAIEAYWRAFGPDDPVLMIVKTSRSDVTRRHRHWRNLFRRRFPSPSRTVAEMVRRRSGDVAPVAVIADETLGEGEMRALHDMGDCFISLARAEGWGLGAFDAARLGKPIVATGFGGQLDYLDAAHSGLVEYTMAPVNEPIWGDIYEDGSRWAEPSVEGAAALLRSVYADTAGARSRAQVQADRIARDFSDEAVAGAMLRALA